MHLFFNPDCTDLELGFYKLIIHFSIAKPDFCIIQPELNNSITVFLAPLVFVYRCSYCLNFKFWLVQKQALHFLFLNCCIFIKDNHIVESIHFRKSYYF